MKTRICPFCGEEISDEAILCKYCHNLLIDENGNDIGPQTAEESVEEEPAQLDDKTIVYSKEELQRAMEEAAAENIDSEEVVEEAEENLAERDQTEDEVYIEDIDDENEVYTYDDEDMPAEEEPEEYADPEVSEGAYDPKRTLIITAIITLGICIIIIAAVCVGYKLFGFGNDDSSSVSQVTTAQKQTTAPTDTQAVTEEYVPQVTDDTVSENPEEIANSEQADPVIESAVDSLTDSSADSSAVSSELDSSASSEADSSSSDSSASSDSLAAPAGSYYNWNEAMQIWDNYVSANGLTDYGYQYGTDGVEMVFGADDGSGNTVYYRVDLVTGAVTAQ